PVCLHVYKASNFEWVFTFLITIACPLLEDALMDRDLVHRQTACAAIKHMALGVYGFGCEDALIHLLNHVWPNIFETSPHLVQAFMDSIEGLRVALGPMKILQYTLQGLFKYKPGRGRIRRDEQARISNEK
ncbi:Splicing factor 3B subunit 1, partial [Homalodisca vitripennis]